MLSAFPVFVDPESKEDDSYLQPFSKLEYDNSYYICGMAVFEQYRNRGIGSMLLELAEQEAQAKAFQILSLIVFEQNSGAKRLTGRDTKR